MSLFTSTSCKAAASLITLFCLAISVEAISIDLKNAIEWNSVSGRTYQLETSDNGVNWTSVGSERTGNNSKLSHSFSSVQNGQMYRVRETTPGIEAPNTTVPNNDFESGILSSWTKAGTHQPSRSSSSAKNGSYSARFYLPGGQNESKLISSRITGIEGGESYSLSFWAKKAQAGPSLILQYEVQWYGTSYGSSGLRDFSLGNNVWQKVNISNLTAPSGATEAVVSFRFVTGAVSGAKGEIFVDSLEFSSGVVSTPDQIQTYSLNLQQVAEITIPTNSGVEYAVMESTNLQAWGNTDNSFVGDGSEHTVLIPAESLSKFVRVMRPEYELFAPSDARASLSLEANSLEISWNPSPTPTVQGYRIYYGTDMNNLDQSIDVVGATSAIVSGLTNGIEYYFAVVAFDSDEETATGSTLFSATPSQSITLVPLYNEATELEPATTIDHEDALITYVGDRGRARHAKEGGTNFQLYDIYKEFYWMGRSYYLEIIDRVAKGGNSITINSTTTHPLATSETRAFYIGGTTLAQYAHNDDAQDGHRDVYGNLKSPIEPMTYTSTVSFNAKEGRPIQIGDRMEIEFSPFMAGLPAGNADSNYQSGGQTNYYGTGFLYIVGEGLKPWYGVGSNLDSYPLPEYAWLGGKTTHHTQYSNEPDHAYKQMAYNLAPINTQKFMLGRRLHHTNFQNGTHSEPNNPIFPKHRYKVGPQFINNSCVACHTNNGRAIPSNVGSAMRKSIVRVGLDSEATIHPTLGTVLQVQATSGSPEKTASRTTYTEIPGFYGDGTPYTLRKPNYSFSGTDPEYYSVRIAPQLVGLGLLEAIDENTIVSFSDPSDLDQDGISGKINALTDLETGETRLGRFGYKASKAHLKHHIASALNTDMGITTSFYPTIDHKNTGSSLEINDEELDLMYRYVALLAVMPQRNFNNANVLQGKRLFSWANCVACHKDEIQTSDYHPLTELRNQTIRPYTDLLLHDMGPGLADNMGEELASGSEWRTAPLWNIGHTDEVSGGEAYLHDGRARSIEEAILWHGGEAEASKEAFRTMSAYNRNALVQFIKSL